MKDFQKEKISAADLLISKKIVKDKHEAEALIISGNVFSNNELVRKSGQKISKNAEIVIKKRKDFVSRGAIKLKKAVEEFDISLYGKIVIDIGSSTGGFTDYMIQNGALLSIAVDVNYGQFDWKLRNDKRIILFERTNIKNLSKNDLPEVPDLAAVDLSFISIKNVFKNIFDLLSEKGEMLLLVKPQFESKKEFVGKNGVVTDKKTHEYVMKELIIFLINDFDVELRGMTYSPLKGAKGNIEFWLYLKKNINENYRKNKINYDRIFEMIEKNINEAHDNLL
ncbi:MAG: TlyA family RNA methyltransferase [Actinomycetota bacterium]|nr:TlyA family RNA methyltransferase [Actinomycetota bacterium]